MIDLREYGYTPDESSVVEGLIPARVTAVHKGRYELICSMGITYGKLKTAAYYQTEEAVPTVGDFVIIQYIPSGDSLMMATLPRKSCFYRKEPGPTLRAQVIAANFDYVFICSSLNQDFNVNRIKRYLTMARQSGGEPVVILTKSDLCETCDEKVDAVKQIAPDLAVIALSSVTGLGLDELSRYMLSGKTIVFLGMSGVGKSSLLNALAGQELMAVKDIREDDARGRHTTTHRQLVKLSSGAMMIDTPGMRELGLWNADEGISASFSNVEELFTACRFSDCSHKSEPGCAVQAALKSGLLTQEQWEGYLAQKRETRFFEDKKGYLSDKQQWHKSIVKYQKNLKKLGGKNNA